MAGLCLELASVGPGVAQVWVDFEVGRSSHDLIASQLSTDDLVISLRYAGGPWLAVSGAIPLTDSGRSWGAAALGGEWLHRGIGPVSVGVVATGQLYGFDAGPEVRTGSAWGLVASGAPTLRIAHGNGYLRLNAGPIASLGDASANEDLRWHHSGLAVAGYSTNFGSTIEAVARYAGVEGRGYPFIGAELSHTLPKGGVWGRGGKWTAMAAEGVEWGAGAYWSAFSRFEVYGSFQREALDPIYRIAPRQNWTFGLSYALRPQAFRESVTVPLEIPTEAGSIRIGRREVSSPPSIAGDFTEWIPVPMELEGAFWVARFDFGPGLYHFAFVDASGNWFLPESIVHRVPDGFGGENGVILVQ